jgi:hypothetical protein
MFTDVRVAKRKDGPHFASQVPMPNQLAELTFVGAARVGRLAVSRVFRRKSVCRKELRIPACREVKT